jgi:hypothetical protein
MSFGMRENGTLVFLKGFFTTGSGGNGGDSFRTVTFLDSTSESLDEEESSDDELDDELADFLALSESVALLSEARAGFLLEAELLSVSELSADEEVSVSEAGRGVFCASELVELLSLSEVLSSALEVVSALSDDEVPFPDELLELLIEGKLAVVFTLLGLGTSSSELQSLSEVEDKLLVEAALRFRVFTFDLGALTIDVSFSSSASLSELLEEDEEDADEDEDGASTISTSLPDSWAFGFFFSPFTCLVPLLGFPFSSTFAFPSGILLWAFNVSHSL